ncbi:calcium:proton antiporter [Brevibacterium linens]|uniref:Ca2+:H+ antiporter n=2 Tax=Brevibacterium linens TaxID=1703 RepID=A0A2H1JDI9_BRELN|nr:calcium:proton antiporter [Brevibacterium linens]AZU01664.1 calcium:proton antiporter [Brevibacterium linens]KAB1943287.1 calcium:proton antiporter [Brevibacterium linens ATCC 9172]SMX85545.1 Ca2+:H+ antiporter [Brevibacterium linens]SMY00978.1 Ca2+:H+ antiporter [Brevibacterium linens ATCC 9172]
MTAALRTIITPTAILRLLLGWGVFIALQFTSSLLAQPVPLPLLVTALVVIIAVILICAFGVVTEAEHLANRLGDPYGSLVLTISICLIEVILIAAVLLGPGDHATIARDSVMAVSMIILNAVIGLCLLVGGLRHGALTHNRTGVSNYLVMIVVFAALAFAVPALIGTPDGAYEIRQEIPIIVVTVGAYVLFLYRQMGPQAHEFIEVAPVGTASSGASSTAGTTQSSPTEAADQADDAPQGIVEILSTHRVEIVVRLFLLVAMVLPIVLLSHDMATLLDDGLGRLGAPVALSGVVIAMIVFLPETLTSLRAAWNGEIQRVSNLCHGAQVSTVGLTIPTVLVIGMLTDQPIVLAESPINLALLAITLLVSVIGFSAKKVTAVQGAAHLIIFVVFGLALFA